MFRSSQWLPFSAMSAHDRVRTKYNQQQRQIKNALLCKSKSTLWLHTVKKLRKETCNFRISCCWEVKLDRRLSCLIICCATSDWVFWTLLICWRSWNVQNPEMSIAGGSLLEPSVDILTLPAKGKALLFSQCIWLCYWAHSKSACCSCRG